MKFSLGSILDKILKIWAIFSTRRSFSVTLLLTRTSVTTKISIWANVWAGGKFFLWNLRSPRWFQTSQMARILQVWCYKRIYRLCIFKEKIKLQNSRIFFCLYKAHCMKSFIKAFLMNFDTLPMVYHTNRDAQKW